MGAAPSQIWRERIALLRHPQLRRLFWGRTISFFGDSLAPVALPFAVLSIGGTASTIGLVLAVSTVTNVVLLLAGGVIADRLSRRLVLMGSDLLQGTSQTVIAVLLWTGQAQVWSLLLAQVLFGAGQALNMPAMTALIPEVVQPKDLQPTNALLSVAQSTAGLIGPGIAGILLVAWGPGSAFAINAVSFLVSALFLARMRITPTTVATTETFVQDLKAGWQELTRRRWYWVSLLAHACWNFAIAFFFVLGPVIARDQLGGPSAWGLIGTALAAGGLVGGLVLLGRTLKRPLLVGNLLLTLAGLQLLSLVGPQPLWVVLLAAGLASAGLGILNGAWSTAVQHLIPAQILARMSSYDWVISLAIMPAGYAAAGPIADALGTTTALWMAAAIIVIPCALTALEPGVRAAHPVPAPGQS